jgi:hypothetical protein
MSHIINYIEDLLSELSKDDIKKIYLEVYPETKPEDEARIMSSIQLTRNFESGGFLEDENSYVIAFLPATTNTLIIKRKRENYDRDNL